jgi:cytochrome c biogenesis protein CcmG, thiol:disulfide interchange protein DsbE
MSTEETETQTAPDRARSLPAWVVVAAFAGLMAFLALVWWGLNRSQQGPIQVNDLVPPFTLYTFDGKEIPLSSLKGKVVVLNFWASWCKPCEAEAAELEQAWKYYQPGGKVMFLGVAWVDTEGPSKEYLKKFNISYPNGPDLRTTISQLFRLKGVPETYIIGKDGRLAAQQIGGFNSLAEIQAMVDEVLAK